MYFSSFDLITQYKISLNCHLNVNFLKYYILNLKNAISIKLKLSNGPV